VLREFLGAEHDHDSVVVTSGDEWISKVKRRTSEPTIDNDKDICVSLSNLIERRDNTPRAPLTFLGKGCQCHFA
jgi:hypothetical protein